MKIEKTKNTNVEMTITIGMKDMQKFTLDLLTIVNNKQISIELIHEPN